MKDKTRQLTFWWNNKAAENLKRRVILEKKTKKNIHTLSFIVVLKPVVCGYMSEYAVSDKKLKVKDFSQWGYRYHIYMHTVAFHNIAFRSSLR